MKINLGTSNAKCPHCKSIMCVDDLIDLQFTRVGVLCTNCTYGSLFVLDNNSDPMCKINSTYDIIEKTKQDCTYQFDLCFIKRVVDDEILMDKLNCDYINCNELIDNKQYICELMDKYGLEVCGFNLVEVLYNNPNYNCNCEGKHIILEILTNTNEIEYLYYIL